VISPKSSQPAPRPFGMYCRPFHRVALLRSCLAAVLCFALSTGAVGGLEAAGNTREVAYAVIFGTVWGPDDRPLYRVPIKIRRENEKKARWELYSDHHGEFAQQVPAGKQDYVIWADLKHRKSQSGNPLHGEEVKVHVDSDERVDTGLHLK
jgi:hypothetical protein